MQAGHLLAEKAAISYKITIHFKASSVLESQWGASSLTSLSFSLTPDLLFPPSDHVLPP